MRIAAALALAAVLALPAEARDVSGVGLADEVTVEGRTLVLNGAGLRRKLIWDVYVCGLWLEHPSHDAGAILQDDAAWLVELHFVRDVDHEKILDGFREAFERNSPGQAERLRPGLVQFHDEVMSKLTVHRGERIAIAYVPGVGSRLTVPDGRSSIYPGKDFADALLRTWIGERPSDRGLENALLGR
ncbi:MAG TPA: chalcone isomerase family protein [Anaeromyxobacteraceae bacterium]|nr:chalcone isomerase family protein [Anaeromyxobacteraceae bacterium]